jgi:transmembrane sensor
MSEKNEQLLLKKLLGSISPEEEKAFQRWLAENPENVRKYNQYRDLWMQTHEEAPEFSPNPAPRSVRTKKPSAKKVKRSRPKWFYVTEAIAVILILVATYLVYDGLKDQPEIHRSGKTVSTVYLNDSTEVTLKANSLLRVPVDFSSDKRIVALEGHAFFKVKQGGDHPFTVEGHHSRIQVLGTSFMVNSRKDDHLDEVTVLEGKVRVSSAHALEEEIIVEPGEKAIIDGRRNAMAVIRSDTANLTAFKDKKFVFDKTPLEDVLRVVEDYFSININVEDRRILKCRLTRTFQDPTVDEVMEVLRVSMNLLVFREYKQYTLHGSGCQ